MKVFGCIMTKRGDCFIKLFIKVEKLFMKITGHKSMSSFNMYYRPTTEDVGSELKRVFDKEEANE